MVFYGFTARVCGSQLISIRPTQFTKSSVIISRMLICTCFSPEKCLPSAQRSELLCEPQSPQEHRPEIWTRGAPGPTP